MPIQVLILKNYLVNEGPKLFLLYLSNVNRTAEPADGTISHI
jgi:hypothetical protein